MISRRAQRIAIGSTLVVVATALLNSASSAFQVSEGIALIFPASAVAVIAGSLLGWWGVAAVVIGCLVLPWGLAAAGPGWALYFAIAAALQAAVPAAARLRAEGSTERRLARFALFGLLLNTLLSALVGPPAVAYLTDTPLSGDRFAFTFFSWFLGDLTTILLLGVPLLLVVRPSLLLDDTQRTFLAEWGTRRTRHAVLLGLVLLVALAMERAAGHGSVAVHWMAMFFLVPVLMSAVGGAAGGGLIANGAVSVVYVLQVMRLISPETEDALFREVLSSYLNLIVFGVAAVVAGSLAGRARALLRELDEHRHQLQHSFEHVVTALAAAIEAKDPTTQGHVQRVARLAVAVGRSLGIDGPRAEMLRYAALLHDVGKIGVPEAILNKPGPLDPEEREQVEKHVPIGMEILRNVDILAPAIPFIHYHQERWDGSTEGAYPGYYGLRGEEIPLEARIIAVVDAYDAMTSDRPYRAAMPPERAVAELREQAGRQFDPQVVSAMVAVLDGTTAIESGRWPVLGGLAGRWLWREDREMSLVASSGESS